MKYIYRVSGVLIYQPTHYYPSGPRSFTISPEVILTVSGTIEKPPLNMTVPVRSLNIPGVSTHVTTGSMNLIELTTLDVNELQTMASIEQITYYDDGLEPQTSELYLQIPVGSLPTIETLIFYVGPIPEQEENFELTNFFLVLPEITFDVLVESD